MLLLFVLPQTMHGGVPLGPGIDAIGMQMPAAGSFSTGMAVAL